jgi:hypothetical protein
MCERRAEPSGDRRRRAACRATLLPQPGFDAPLLSVHLGLIAQAAGTYPSSGKPPMGGNPHGAHAKEKEGMSMARDSVPRPRRRLWWATVLLLTAEGCADPPPQVSVAAPPVPAGQARIWFYRNWLPSESLNLANIDVNGSYYGSVANGSVFYRDVPPGHYHIAPVSYNRDFNQDRDVDVAPGQQLYIKILSSQSWDGACRNCVRDTFYAWLIPQEVAQAEIVRGRSGI